MQKSNIFSQFTNLYELSKTLRFELKPIANTSEILKKENVFNIDKKIQQKYEATKPFFDMFHRDFVEQSLKNTSMEKLEEYFEIYKKYIKDKKNKAIQNKLTKLEKFLRNQIITIFNNYAEKLKKDNPDIVFKKSGTNILFEESIFLLLKKIYSDDKNSQIKNDDQNISIFDSWKGFTGYFIKFFETRKNFYKGDGTSSAIATRIVDQNLRIFCDNILLYKKIKNSVDFTNIEKVFQTSFEELFSPQAYNRFVLQNDIDLYNRIVGGETKANGTKIKGLNELINEYRQTHKGKRLPFFKKLDKQILSDVDKDFINVIENDHELKRIIKQLTSTIIKKSKKFNKLIKTLNFHPDSFEINKIYISKKALNTILYKWTDQTYKLESLLYNAMKSDNPKGLKYNKIQDSFKFPEFIALSYIAKALEKNESYTKFWKDRFYKSDNPESGFLDIGENLWNQFLQIYYKELQNLQSRPIIIKNKNGQQTTKLIGLNHSLIKIKNNLTNFNLSESCRHDIKNFADDVLHYYQLAKYFSVEKKKVWNLEKLDLGDFYTNPEIGYEVFYKNSYEEIIKPYNQIRNYLTKKPFSTKKWKLNFKNPTLAGGWDKNKEKANSTIILRKDSRYYLAIMTKNHNDLFTQKYENKFKGSGYQKMVYKLLPGPNKMMPKVCFSKKGLELFKPNKEILDIYQNSKFKQGDNFSQKAMHKLIDFYKACLTKYDGWKVYNFSNLKPTSEYQTNIGEFYNDVAKSGYKISWENISEKYIQEKNKKGELYLFEIHNKDWNLKDGKPKTGSKNLHTLYLESLFSEENAKHNFIIKLSGEAELFYRPKTAKEKLGYHSDKQGRKVIKNKRYSQDKIFLHLSIQLNRGKGNVYRFNSKINKLLKDNPDINVIGVDRGEKHLAYYSVINQKGEILESDTLNKINGIDYFKILTNRADKRQNQRKDWQAIEDIKNLKKGYVSQVVRKLSDLAIKYNAIIVLEDLNMRFKQIRGGIEKSIYQQLEKALIDKLSYLVNKDENDPSKPGYTLKAFQLTAPFESFKDMGKQTGIIFYTQANYTSKIDPVSGWRPNLYLKYSNAKQAKEDILKFSDIKYRANRFEITYDLKSFINSPSNLPNSTVWTICSNVERFRWNRKLNNNQGGYDHYENLTDNFNKLLKDVNINIENNILQQIKDLKTTGNEKFFKKFIFLFNLICQIRNTNPDAKGNDADFILSPVAPFFDSRRPKDFGKNLPNNGDDNGAFNIARKGLMILQKISKAKDIDKIKWNDLFISNADWDNFAKN